MSPQIYQMVEKYEQKDKELVSKLKSANHHTKYFRGGGMVIHMETM